MPTYINRQDEQDKQDKHTAPTLLTTTTPTTVPASTTSKSSWLDDYCKPKTKTAAKTIQYKPKSSIIMDTPVEVTIAPQASARLDAYIKHASGEVSGLGLVEKDGDKFHITEVFLFEQESSASDTELCQDDVSKFLVELATEGVDTSKLRLWWHSHANMATFWSSTDESNIRRINTDWLLSVVGNKKGEYLARLDFISPITLTLDDVPFTVAAHLTEEEEAAIVQEIKDKVTPVTYWYPYGKGSYGKSYYSAPATTGKQTHKPIGTPRGFWDDPMWEDVDDGLMDDLDDVDLIEDIYLFNKQIEEEIRRHEEEQKERYIQAIKEFAEE